MTKFLKLIKNSKGATAIEYGLIDQILEAKVRDRTRELEAATGTDLIIDDIEERLRDGRMLTRAWARMLGNQTRRRAAVIQQRSMEQLEERGRHLTEFLAMLAHRRAVDEVRRSERRTRSPRTHPSSRCPSAKASNA